MSNHLSVIPRNEKFDVCSTNEERRTFDLEKTCEITRWESEALKWQKKTCQGFETISHVYFMRGLQKYEKRKTNSHGVFMSYHL